MGKNPAFSFYSDDFIGGTSYMSHEEVGAYLRLLLDQFGKGHLTMDHIRRRLGQDHERLWAAISDKFISDSHDRWYNQRMDEVKLAREAYSQSRANNRKKKPISDSQEKDMKNISSTSQEDMGIRNKDKGEGIEEEGRGEGQTKNEEKTSQENSEDMMTPQEFREQKLKLGLSNPNPMKPKSSENPFPCFTKIAEMWPNRSGLHALNIADTLRMWINHANRIGGLGDKEGKGDAYLGECAQVFIDLHRAKATDDHLCPKLYNWLNKSHYGDVDAWRAELPKAKARESEAKGELPTEFDQARWDKMTSEQRGEWGAILFKNGWTPVKETKKTNGVPREVVVSWKR